MEAPEPLNPLGHAVRRLHKAGIDTPNLDASLILCKVLGCSRTDLIARADRILTRSQEKDFESLIARRVAREPLPHLLGEWEFMGRRYEVGRQALIPRPETEILVEAVVERLRRLAEARVLRLLDAGTGTGCIAIELALRLPHSLVTGVEVSSEALELAARNVARFELQRRVTLLHIRFPDEVRDLGPFDAIISNPPYIPSAEVDCLAPELVRCEPRAALDGGPDGLDVIRALVSESRRLLKPRGLLAMEIGHDQAEGVSILLREAGWKEIEVIPDLAGISRIVTARA